MITLTLNSDKTLNDSLLSVQKQIKGNYVIEHIFVDGGSIDNTLQIIDNCNTKNKKVINEPASGIYKALNEGIKHANGEIIGIIHSDDLFANNAVLATIIKTFEKNNCDAVYADLQYVSKQNTNKVIRNWKSGIYTPRKIKFGWMPPHPTFFAKRELFGKYGFYNTSFSISADYELMLRFITHKINISYIPEVIVKMRIGGTSNRSLKNIIQKMKEDHRAVVINKVGNWLTVFFKNIRKLHQLFNIRNLTIKSS